MERGCQMCEKYKEHYYKDHVNGKGMEFYQVMDADFSLHLTIPKKFTDYCKNLPATVDLKDPSGNIWSVGLHKTDDKILMDHGWKEFVEAHHLCEKDLIVFKYDGDSCFEISVFDERNCKRSPFNLLMDHKLKKNKMCQDSMEILDVNPRRKVIVCCSSSSPDDDSLHAPPSNRVGLNFQSGESSHKRRVTRRNELFVRTKNGQHKTSVVSKGTRDYINQESVGHHRNNTLAQAKVYMSKSKHVTDEERTRVLQWACTINPNNPGFALVLSMSNIYKARVIHVPVDFWKHIPAQNCDLSLRVPGQRKKWHVNLRVYKSMIRFCWSEFVADNSLQVGDACFFELIKDKKDIELEVHILRAHCTRPS